MEIKKKIVNNLNNTLIFPSLIVTGSTIWALNHFSISNRIVRKARKYLNVKEYPQNKAFTDKKFEAKLRKVGWQKGKPWCAYFVKLVMYDVFGKTKKWTILNKLLTGSTCTTWNNFVKNKGWWTLTKTPCKGCIMVRLKECTSETWVGHFGIVEKNLGNGYFITIEGNFANKVSRVKRKLDFKHRDKSNTVLVGFIKLY